jgi:hypothetical protein
VTLDGQSAGGAFDYRIVARRLGYEDLRLETAEDPNLAEDLRLEAAEDPNLAKDLHPETAEDLNPAENSESPGGEQ